MDTWIWILIAVVAVLVVVVIAVTVARNRRARLRDRFGAEYNRTVDTADNRREAERELRDRAARRDELELTPLTPGARERFEERWQTVQAAFVDRPVVAVADADDLLTQVMRERGYPVDDFESQSALVSVDHPEVAENYRRGHEIYTKTVDGSATTEDLRQAVISYRSLFEELMRETDVDREDAGHQRSSG